MHHRAFALVGFCVLTLGTALAGYVFQNIVDPSNPTYTKALGINNSRTIAGYGDGASPRGFVLGLPASFTNQSFPGTTSTRVAGISGTGATVGSRPSVRLARFPPRRWASTTWARSSATT
jgi:hypothetical protein